MSKRIRYSIYAAVAVYFIGLIVFLPARLVVGFAPLPENIQLQGISGTVWNGRVDYVQFDGRALEQIEWQVFPLALLAGQIAADVRIAATEANPITGSSHIQAGLFSSVRVENARFNAELGKLSAWLDIPNLVPLQGDVVLGITEFELGNPVCSSLDSRVGVYAVKTRIGRQWHSLGDFAMQLGCEEGWASVQVNPENSLGLTVNGRFAPGNVDLGVAMRPSSSTPAPIRDLLRMVGEPDSSGQFSFRIRL
ncbi:type II secretion system protein N [Aliidiomarina quisquiliarum]|uniref:type II secretion system protein N n=1 Tax=Aliidiomarina quisquiliarum TaxID=2938947 RepID=UPI00208E0745|nr:type II secretion system protein N [Aliidiomarina quisquiliarum]MCO4321584.1 type II secretion system protein N [Aliidiomarina quisquiliarum]